MTRRTRRNLTGPLRAWLRLLHIGWAEVLLVVGLLTGGLLGAACSVDAPAASLELENVNIVLIVVDTLGAEHLGAYHPELGNSPNIDQLARGGVMFRHAYSTAPWTQPSIASLLTSLMPSQHGLVKLKDALPGEATTLAELLDERGFRTAGFVTHTLLEPKYGFDQGFAHYDTSATGNQNSITSSEVTDLAVKWIGENADSRFFTFVHYFDPHYRYHHHEEFDLTSGYRGELEDGMRIRDLHARLDSLTEADVEYLVGLYREEIAFTDHHIGRLIKSLDELQLREKTLVIFAADHGEEFLRHGWLGHSITLHDELIRVPLIFNLPGTLSPRVIDTSASLLDVVPTLLALSSRPEASPNDWAGQSLVPRLLGDDTTEPVREIYGEISLPQLRGEPRGEDEQPSHTSLVVDGRKVIHQLSNDRWAFYNLRRDPEELDNRTGKGQFEIELKKRLRKWEAELQPAYALPVGAPLEFDDEEMEQLKALGYVK